MKSPSRRRKLAQDSKLIGAIGCSGGANAEDETICLAGAGTINGAPNLVATSEALVPSAARWPRRGSGRFERAAQTAASPRERTSSEVSFPGSSRVKVCLPWFGDDWLEATHGEAATGMFAVAL
jgi:hypothetical protein